MNPKDFRDPRRPVDFKLSSIVASLKKGPVLASDKYDGVRLHVVVTPEGRIYFRSRAGLHFPALSELEARANSEPIPRELLGFTGEYELIGLHPDGNPMTAAQTAGVLASHTQVTRGSMLAVQFDMVSDGLVAQKLNHAERMALDEGASMRQLVRSCFRVIQVRCKLCRTLEDIEESYQLARQNRLEGIIIVPASVGYTSGRKVGAGWKMKPSITTDGIATGFTEAVSEGGAPLGRIASMTIDYEDGTQGTASAGAMSHGEREDVWRNPEAYLGRCVEVTAMERYGSGQLRHPNFYRWRDLPHMKGVKV